MTKRTTPGQSRRIAELHEEGHTLTAIAEQLGLDRHTVARHINSPLERKDPWSGVTPQALQTLVKLAAVTQAFACPKCKAEVLRLLSQHEGFCCLRRRQGLRVQQQQSRLQRQQRLHHQ